MPGIADSADRSVRRRRWPRWKLTAKRCASSRSCCSTNISALLGRIGIASFACGEEDAIGLLRRGWFLGSTGAAGAAGSARRSRAPPVARRLHARGQRRGSARSVSAARRSRPSRRSRRLSPRPPPVRRSSRSFASATIDRPTPGRTSMPTSRAAASAIASCPLPPSTTIRSGSFQASSPSRPPRARGGTAATAPRTSTRSRRCGCDRVPPRRRGAHLVRAVARLLRPPVDEHHHRRHRREPLQVRDVVALDRRAAGAAASAASAACPAPARCRRARCGAWRSWRRRSCAPARPACGDRRAAGRRPRPSSCAPPRRRAPLGQPLRLQRRVLDLDRQQHLVGRRRAQVVVEADERRQQLGVGELLPGERERAAAAPACRRGSTSRRSPARSPRGDSRRRPGRRSRSTPPAAPPASPRARGSDRGSSAAMLELGARRRVLHARRAAGPSSSSLLPSRNRRTSRTCSPYASRAHRQHARRRAALDLVLQARAPPVVQHVVGAGAQLEVAVDHAQRLAARRRRVVRARSSARRRRPARARPRAAATRPWGPGAAPGSSCRP